MRNTFFDLSIVLDPKSPAEMGDSPWKFSYDSVVVRWIRDGQKEEPGQQHCGVVKKDPPSPQDQGAVGELWDKRTTTSPFTIMG